MAAPRVRSPEQFAGEHKALQARFGDSVRILDTREPTLFEDMIGLSSIVHVRTAEGREVGCGVGWHGAMAFVLEANFPRFATQFTLEPQDAAAVDAATAANGLVRGETRLDENGIAVVCRCRGSEALFLLRPSPVSYVWNRTWQDVASQVPTSSAGCAMWKPTRRWRSSMPGTMGQVTM